MTDTMVTSKEALKILGFKGANTLTNLAKKGLIKRKKCNSKVIYYDLASLLYYKSGSSLDK
jgi:hypothetical protein